jgi:hypothetical protein
VAEDVAAAVDAGALAVPEAEDAFDPALAAQRRLLAAPERGRREVLVEPWLERTSAAASCLPARTIAWSTPPSGEPR